MHADDDFEQCHTSRHYIKVSDMGAGDMCVHLLGRWVSLLAPFSEAVLPLSDAPFCLAADPFSVTACAGETGLSAFLLLASLSALRVSCVSASCTRNKWHTSGLSRAKYRLLLKRACYACSHRVTACSVLVRSLRLPRWGGGRRVCLNRFHRTLATPKPLQRC